MASNIKKERTILPVPESTYDDKVLSEYLGQFVIEFERLMDNLRTTISTVLYKEGLKETFYSEILMHDSTTKNLTDYYCATLKFYLAPCIPEWLPSETEKNKIDKKEKLETERVIHTFIEKVYSKLGEIGKVRNTFLHSPWQSMHFKSAVNFVAERFSVNGKGAKNKYHNETVSPETFINLLTTLKY